MVKKKRRLRDSLFFLTLFVVLFLTGIKAEAKTRGTVSIGNNVFSAEFENNKAAKAFVKKFPVTWKMSDLNGNEKYKYLKSELPANEKAVKKIKAGDIMLYGSDCIVVFYESFSTDYKYTRLGRITDTKGLSDALGTGSVKVKFSKKPALNKKRVTLEEGETFTLKLAGASSKNVKWKSSNKKIVSVSKRGTITAKKNGKAEVTAVYKKKEYNCIVTVKSAPEQNSTDSEAQPEPSGSIQDNIEQPEPSGGGSGSIQDNVEQPERNWRGLEETTSAVETHETQSEEVTATTAESSTVEETANEEEQLSETESTESEDTMRLLIGETEVPVTWEENASVEALMALCPLTIQMSMYGGFEQVGSIGQSIVRDDIQTNTSFGDIVLYSGSQIVIFYGSNSWAYTRLGHVDLSQQEVRELLGGGDVAITLEYSVNRQKTSQEQQQK